MLLPVQMQEYCRNGAAKKKAFDTSRGANIKRADRKNAGKMYQQAEHVLKIYYSRQTQTVSPRLRLLLAVALLVPGCHGAQFAIARAKKLGRASTEAGHGEQQLTCFESTVCSTLHGE
jgi:hypothetical protein